MHLSQRRAGLAALVVLGLASTALAGSLVQSDEPPPAWSAPILAASQRYAQAMTAADATQIQAAVTPELWKRMTPMCSSSSCRAGMFGTLEALQDARLVKPGYAVASVLCRQPDGVEDVVTVTVKQVGAGWLVCGGPSGATKHHPFQ